jgi:hypothetical protein
LELGIWNSNLNLEFELEFATTELSNLEP